MIGPNGAGKTTCFNLLTKFLSPTRGSIKFKGQDITAHAAGRRRPARLGALVPDFSGLSAYERAGKRPHRAAARARRILRFLALDFGSARPQRARPGTDRRCRPVVVADWNAVELPYGRKRALEIATTLALDPEMLLLDEPTAGMGHEDIDRIAQLIKRVARRPHRADGRA
ncbi:MAG: ATP-binding cassette domain-containing protein [Pseudolabrys sp.]